MGGISQGVPAHGKCVSKDRVRPPGSLALWLPGGLPWTVSVEREAGHDWEGFQHVRSWNTVQREEGRGELWGGL